jgi:integrase
MIGVDIMSEEIKEKKKIGRKSYMLIKDVQPIRTEQGIEDMKWALKRHCGLRDYMVFLIGINTGLRCGDIVALKISDVIGKTSTVIQEGKTKKSRRIHFHAIKDELDAYIDTLKAGKPTKWLFPSRKGDNHIGARQIYTSFQKAADMAGLKSVGCHTARKTFGYWHYKEHKNVAVLQKILNHSKPEVTRVYIGITDDEVWETLKDFRL